MREIERIAEALRRAYEGPAWHGPALRPILADVTAEQANARPVQEAHSIRELAAHIATWLRAALNGIETGRVEVSDAEDYPAAEAGGAAWRECLADLERAYQRLHAGILRLEDTALERELLTDEVRYSGYLLLHGAIHHTLYHAGQIMLLKRAAAGVSPGGGTR